MSILYLKIRKNTGVLLLLARLKSTLNYLSFLTFQLAKFVEVNELLLYAKFQILRLVNIGNFMKICHDVISIEMFSISLNVFSFPPKLISHSFL